MRSDDEIIKAVMNFPGGCKEQKEAFLKTLDIDLPKVKKTVIITLEVDITDAKVPGNSYLETHPSEWIKSQWVSVIRKPKQGDIDYHSWLGPKGSRHIEVTNVETKNG